MAMIENEMNVTTRGSQEQFNCGDQGGVQREEQKPLTQSSGSSFDLDILHRLPFIELDQSIRSRKRLLCIVLTLPKASIPEMLPKNPLRPILTGSTSF